MISRLVRPPAVRRATSSTVGCRRPYAGGRRSPVGARPDHTLVDFTGEEAFEAADDLASGPAASRPAGDVVDRRLVEPHADDDRALEGGVRLSVPAPIETMPAGRHPGRSRDRAGTAQLRKGGF